MPYFIVDTSSGIPRDPGAQALTVIYAASQAAIPANDTYVAGPYGKQTAANAALKSMGGGPGSLPSQIHNAQGPGLPSPLGGLAAIGDFFGRLSEGSTWIRVGEVVLGLILLAVGVARITHAVPAATKIAKTVGAVAV